MDTSRRDDVEAAPGWHEPTRRASLGFATGVAAMALLLAGTGISQGAFLVPQTHHPGVFFEKYATPLPYFDGTNGPARVDGDEVPGTPLVQDQTVTYEEFRQRVLPETFYDGGGPLALPPALPPYDEGTLVWGYNVGDTDGDCSTGPLTCLWPGVTIETEKGTPTQVTYVNNLAPAGGHVGPELQRYLTIDQTIHWANPLELPGPPVSRLEEPPYAGPQPVVPHLHGGETPSAFDGHPNAWFTSADSDIRGTSYRTLAGAGAGEAIYYYPNGQEPATLWFHDHALGITRINVYAGTAAYYFLRDANSVDDGVDDADATELPKGDREVEFVIQDRMFDILGNLLFPDGPPFFVPNAQHPFWNPEFLGDVNTVNGRSWPFLDVDPQRYRIRFLNGSNARFYNLAFSGGGGGKGKKKGGTAAVPFWVIGNDGGLLDDPVETSSLLISPGERYDVIVDFAGLEGQVLTLLNDAKAPWPFGETADPQTVGQVAEFRVSMNTMTDGTYDPAMDTGGTLREGLGPINRLANPDGTLAVVPDRVRQLTLNEIPGPAGPLDAVLNNTRWGGLRDDGTATSSEGLFHDSGTVAPLTDYISEMPQIGTTEVWEIINLTGDAHPIHLHLVQFQVLNREDFSVRKYTAEYERNFPGGAAANPNQAIFIPHFGPPLDYNTPNADGALGGNPAIGPFLSRKGPTPPEAYEIGWKDTVIVPPRQVTRIAVRWANQSGGAYPFDATAIGDPVGGVLAGEVEITGEGSGGGGGPGYVWHCHILDHEDNEMMRPYVPVNNPNNTL